MEKAKKADSKQITDVLLDKLKNQEQRVAEAELMNQALIASIGEGVILVNEYGDITTVNNNALEMLGYDRQEMEGKWLPRVLPSIDKDGNEVQAAERPVMQSLLTGKPVGATVRYLKKDGSTIPIFTTASPLVVSGVPRGAIIIFRDISQEMLIDQAKNEFISLTSHQLRTPLTAINLFTQLLKEPASGSLNKPQKNYVDKIQTSTERLLQLVSDFLNISKLELGGFEPEMAIIDIRSFINDQIKELAPLISEHKISITISPSTKPMLINTDVALLSEVTHNLLTNAIRYSNQKNGKINIKLKINGQDLILAVADNGIGIGEEAKNQIFQRLYRAENARAHQPDGTGLGLYLVKKIVESIEGSIWFESQENKGTTFYVRLPINIENPDAK